MQKTAKNYMEPQIIFMKKEWTGTEVGQWRFATHL